MHSATPAFSVTLESLMQVLWKCADFLSSSLWFKMSCKSRMNSEGQIHCIKHIHVHYLFSLFVSSTSESKTCCQVTYFDNQGTSPFPRKMNLGSWEWLLINTLTAELMVKGSAPYCSFCKGKYSDSCVRKNMLTNCSPCSLQVTTVTANGSQLLLKVLRKHICDLSSSQLTPWYSFQNEVFTHGVIWEELHRWAWRWEYWGPQQCYTPTVFCISVISWDYIFVLCAESGDLHIQVWQMSTDWAEYELLSFSRHTGLWADKNICEGKEIELQFSKQRCVYSVLQQMFQNINN